MIKRWSHFNEDVEDVENTNDNIKEIFIKKLSDIREIMTDFEDMGIIKYGINFPSSSYFDPSYADSDGWIDYAISIIKFYKKGDKLCITSFIELPAEIDEDQPDQVIVGADGIKLLDDILTANSRLIDMGFDVKLQLDRTESSLFRNKSRSPIKFLIYFNI